MLQQAVEDTSDVLLIFHEYFWIKTITTINVTMLNCVWIAFCLVTVSPVPSGVSIDGQSTFQSDNKGLIDIGNHSSIKESKQIQIKRELEMPGSSGGRGELIPDIENGGSYERKPKLSLKSQKSLRFELGKNLEDASDEVRDYFKNLQLIDIFFVWYYVWIE